MCDLALYQRHRVGGAAWKSTGVALDVALVSPCTLQAKVAMSTRGRRLRYPSRLHVPPSPVTVRSMSNPKPGWKLADAVDLVRQGYSVAHAARVTGWAASVIEAQRKASNRTR